MSKLIMLDFDGVVADSLEATCRATITAMQQHGFAHLASREVVLELVEANWFEGLQKIGVPLAVSHTVDDLFAELAKHGEVEPFADMPGVIARLAERHRVLIVTSNRSDIVEGLLSRWGIVGVSEVLGGEKETSKARKIDMASHRYPRHGERWLVGDTVGDILEGRAAGAGTVAVTWGWHSEEQLRGASPDRVADTPRDLLSLLLGTSNEKTP